jgi:hypothetical protein
MVRTIGKMLAGGGTVSRMRLAMVSAARGASHLRLFEGPLNTCCRSTKRLDPALHSQLFPLQLKNPTTIVTAGKCQRQTFEAARRARPLATVIVVVLVTRKAMAKLKNSGLDDRKNVIPV